MADLYRVIYNTVHPDAQKVQLVQATSQNNAVAACTANDKKYTSLVSVTLIAPSTGVIVGS